MKKLLTFTILLYSAITLHAQGPCDIIIRDVSIVSSVDSILIKGNSVGISNGIISQISLFDKIPKSEKTIIVDGKNKFVLPGLVDMHAHLPELNKLDTFIFANLAAGITRVRAMYSIAPILEVRKIVLKKNITPQIYYPYIIPRNSLITKGSDMDSLFNIIKKEKYDFIKIFGVQNESVFQKIITAANYNNIITCGHCPRNVKLETVIKSGYKSIEHLGGYDALKSGAHLDSIIVLTKQHNLFNCPTLDWDVIEYNIPYPNDFVSRITYKAATDQYKNAWNKQLDAIIKEMGQDGIIRKKEEYLNTFKFKQEVLKKLNMAGCQLLIGGDAGSQYQLFGYNVYEEMVNWAKAGISNFEILKAATLTPAKFFNEENKWGSIETGKQADILILRENPLVDIENIQTIEGVIKGGKIVDRKLLLSKF